MANSRQVRPTHVVSSPVGRSGYLGICSSGAPAALLSRAGRPGVRCRSAKAKFAKHLDLVVNRALAASLPMISGTGRIAAAVEEECPQMPSIPPVGTRTSARDTLWEMPSRANAALHRSHPADRNPR